MIRSTAVIFLATVCCVARAYGQDSVAASPKFDVASVRAGDPFVSGVSFRMNGGPGTADPGRITYTRVSLKNLLMKAYGKKIDEIGGPAWLNDVDANNNADFYTITATMPRETTTQQFQIMLQNLLAERFHLVVHHETRDFPGYELVVANGGPKLMATEKDAGAFVPPTGPPVVDANGFPRLRPGSPGSTMMPRPGTWGMIRSTNRVSMTQFTAGLGAMINESNGAANTVIPRVVDKTGLSGVYEFHLEFAGMLVFSPGLAAALNAGGGLAASPAASDPGEIGPTLFNALEKQLGLKLEKVKSVPVDMVIVDHVDRVPTEN